MSEYKRFLNQARQKIDDLAHHSKINKAISTYDAKVDEMRQSQFRNWEQARTNARQIKNYVLNSLPQLLQKFEQNISARGVTVLWAETAAEACNYFLQIAREYQAKKIIKSKSMTTEEIAFNEMCEQHGLEVWESDLGELIVQLAGEKPYHIVTPAMHKSTAEISQLFHEKLGSPLTDSAAELTMVARKHLRQAYVTADIGVTGANFLLAEEGAIGLTENEGNGRLSTACPPVHVVFAGIEKIIPSQSELALFLPLLATSGTGQQITCYNSIIRGPRRQNESDGPQKMYVILLDNGRSQLYGEPHFREILRCIRCGACLNACPVFRLAGGHTYHTPYQGPVGAVLTPHLQGWANWYHLPLASSLCAACSSVCPVHIELHQLLLENRWQAYQNGYGGLFWNIALKTWAYFFARRHRLDMVSKPLRRWGIYFTRFLPAGKRKRVPVLPRKSFKEIWMENEQQG
jgi:L-lactate dehydrogenase complex protein LldF